MSVILEPLPKGGQSGGRARVFCVWGEGGIGRSSLEFLCGEWFGSGGGEDDDPE